VQVTKFILTIFRSFFVSRVLVRNIGIGLLLLGGCTASVLAQDLPDVAQGLQPYVAYHGGQLDKVNIVNGSLTVQIPLVSYPQKGSLSLSYSVIYNSFSFQDLANCLAAENPTGPLAGIPLDSGCTNQMQLMPLGIPGAYPPGPALVMDQGLAAGGTSASAQPGNLQPPLDGRFYIITPDRAQHPLAPYSDGTYRSIDEGGYSFTPSSAPAFGTNLGNWENAYPGDQAIVMGGAGGSITDSHGIVYTSSGITDPDGNSINVGVPSGMMATDSTGRQIPQMTTGNASSCPNINAPFQSVTSAMQWIPPGSGNGYLFCYTNVLIYTNLPFGGPFGGARNGSSNLRRTYSMLQSIVLPNGQYWGFIYDAADPNAEYGGGANNFGNFGQLLTLIYPTGGSVNYTYAIGGGFCPANRPNGTNGVAILPYIPNVGTRQMVDPQGNALGTWTYGGGSGVPEGDLSILSPTGDLTVIDLAYDTVNQTSCSLFDAGEQVYQGSSASGPLLRSTTRTYLFPASPGTVLASVPRVINEVTTLDDGESSSVQSQYAIANFGIIACSWPGTSCGVGNYSVPIPIGSATSKTYIGYGGSVMKTENIAYAWQSIPAYLSANILDIPLSTSTQDGSGNTIGTTNYTYDESAYAPGETSVAGHLTTVSKTLNMASGPAPTVHTGWNTGSATAPGNGDKAYVIDANGNTTSYAYNGTGGCSGSVVTSTTNALSQSISGSYDCNTGLLTSLTDLNGNTTSVSWDMMRRITQVSYPAIASGTPTTTFTYADSANTVTKTVTASPDPSQITTVVFDSFGRDMNRYTSDGSSAGQAEVDTYYDPDGRVASVTNPYHSSDTVYSTTTTYDALNRPLVITKPDGNTTTTSYTGPTTDTFDENNTHMQHTTDALDRLVKVMELGTSADPRSLETDYTYNALDDLTYVNQIGASGETPRTRSFTYDSLSRLITSTNPESGTICYGTLSSGSCINGYDANSNLLAKTDANGVTTSYTYDALNRLKKRTSNGTPALNNQYGYDSISDANPAILPLNGVGRLMFTTSGPTSTATDAEIFSYDAMGRLKALEAHLPSALSTTESVFQSYDLAGNPTQTTYPDGRVLLQSYDSAGRLTTVTDTTSGGAGTVYFSPTSGQAQYTAAGALSSASYGNGVTEAITYNTRLQPCHTSANSPALAPISGVGNVFDRTSSYANSPSNGSPCNPESGNNGNIAYIADNHNANWTQSFAYDGLNRLTSAARSDGGYNHTYNYDSFGNLIVQDNINPSPTYTINPATNQLNRLANNVNIYNYDNAGNLLSSGTSDIGGHSYTYNPLSQITAVDGGNTATYFYNGSNQRIEKQAGGLTTDYIDFAGQPLAEHTSAGIWTDYIYAEGQKIAKVATPAGGTSTLNYYLDDHLGTTQVELDASDNVTWQGQFTPFGAELPDGSTTMHYKFTGKERDAESGLDFFGARYYGSTTGRWMSPDWAAKPEAVPYSKLDNPQSLNLYNYVGNNPLSRADVDGHVWPILALAGSGTLLTEESPLAALGPIGWSIIGATAVTAAGVAIYEHYHQKGAAPAATPSTEQGRDEQGKFLPVKPGQARPGAQTESDALEAEGASKNTKPLPGSIRIPDGTVDATGQKVEVKGGKVVGNTEQLREMGAAAVAATGQRLLVVTTNPNVKVTQNAQDNKDLEIRPVKTPQ